MGTSHRNELTTAHPEGRFFLDPRKTTHRQYEALRAYFVDGLPSHEVARLFGYSPGSFRVLSHQFRKESEKADRFFKDIVHGPQHAPVRDRLRDRVVALRKKNLSVYDIQRELSEAGEQVSINALSVLLREEGFERLPRRRDEERPKAPSPDVAPVADVRELSPEPRSFRTDFAGLFFFLPLLASIDLARLAARAELPGSKMIPAGAALRSALALKLVNTERKSHVMQNVFDEGLALFSGLNVMPKRSWFSVYSSRVGRQTNRKLMELWFDEVHEAGVLGSGSIDLDFHSVPANPSTEPLEKHYVSKRSRSQKAVLVFLARDADERVLCYANAAIPKNEKNGEIIRFAEFYRQRTAAYPHELVFDSQLTTYDKLDWLRQKNIHFLTLRRRHRKLLGRIYSLPSSMWRRATLRSLTRKYRNPKFLDEKIKLDGYHAEIRQLSILDLGHDDPTILLTNNFRSRPATLITRYAKRMLIENAIAEAIHFFHIDALSSMVDLNVDFDLQITLMGSALYRMFADRLPDNYRRAQAKTIFANLLDVGGTVDIGPREVVVTLDRRAHNPILADTGLINRPTPMPWFFGKRLILQLP